MILQALNDHYRRLLDDPQSGIAPPGYSKVDVSYVLVLSSNGQLADVYPVEIEQLVPEHKKRQGQNPPPYFLCDKIMYSLGIGKNTEEGVKRYIQYREYNLNLLEKAMSPEAQIVKKFLAEWDPEQWEKQACLQRCSAEFTKPITLNTVYQIDGATGFFHQLPEIIDLWESEYLKEDDQAIRGQCLITGQMDTIAKTHDVGISGISSKANAALVSFNCDAFESYGKAQSYNAPVGKRAAAAYAKALNYLIASDTNRVRLADTTVVFWADKQGGRAEESVLAWCLDPVSVGEEEEDDGKRRIDPATARQAKAILERVKAGLPAGDASFAADTRCYLLGLAPNAARLAVRFWQVSSFGDVLDKIARHYSDMQISGSERFGGLLSPWRTLKAIAVQEDAKNIPSLLSGQLLRAILTGQMYPQTVYNAALLRCRTGGEHGGANAARAAVIKAFLLRKYRIHKQLDKEARITVGLNTDNTDTAYLLGRLFSLLEKVQKDALGGNINASIRDRYFGAASATPAAVFPLLLRLSRHHIAKANYGSLADRKIQEVANGLDKFPAHLNMEEQGQFILGYYHQNQANYAKNESTGEGNGHDGE